MARPGRSQTTGSGESALRVLRLRPVSPRQARAHARGGILQVGLYAHSRYVKAHGAPTTPDELLAHSLIGFDKHPSIRRLPKLGVELDRAQFALRCDSDLGQYAALRAGFGIGFCQVALARRERLIAILPDLVRFDMPTWLVMHRDMRSSRRVRLLFDHLAHHLEAHVAAESA